MKFATASILVAVSISAVGCAPPPTISAPAAERIVKFRSGNAYTVEVASDPWRTTPRAYPFEAAAPPAAVGTTIMAAAKATPTGCTAKPAESDGRSFHGSAREVPKTTLPSPNVEYEYFDSITELRKDIRANSDDFDMMDSGIGTRCNQLRVKEENRMVVVGYLYAIKREDDNDYHLILGTKSCKTPGCFMTAEVTGVPRLAKNRAALAKARDEFEDQITDFTPSGGLPGGSSYLRFQPPIPVRVSGPLFYDADHKIDRDTRAGAVGPAYARPSTSWEIHPVVNIEFEPKSDGQPLTIARMH